MIATDNTCAGFDLECNTFSARKQEDLIIIKFNDHFLLRTSDLSARDLILSYLTRVSESDQVKAVILVGSPEKKGCEEYFDFYDQVLSSSLGSGGIHRMFNVINQLILALISMEKIVIHCNSGRIISSFFNISLACDYRIISADTVFQNPCLSLGLLPKGGGAFFLPRIVGLSKAYEILLSEEEISAQKALELGIVNRVVPVDDLLPAAIQTANAFLRRPASLLSGIKRLLNFSLKDLKEYLDFENQTLLRVILSSEEWKNRAA